jgi:hypothetical protein
MAVVTALLNRGSHRLSSSALFAAAFPQELVLALEWLGVRSVIGMQHPSFIQRQSPAPTLRQVIISESSGFP